MTYWKLVSGVVDSIDSIQFNFDESYISTHLTTKDDSLFFNIFLRFGDKSKFKRLQNESKIERCVLTFVDSQKMSFKKMTFYESSVIFQWFKKHSYNIVEPIYTDTDHGTNSKFIIIVLSILDNLPDFPVEVMWSIFEKITSVETLNFLKQRLELPL